jgi:hypothetical protein
MSITEDSGLLRRDAISFGELLQLQELMGAQHYISLKHQETVTHMPEELNSQQCGNLKSCNLLN